jgi:hypothetical protein
MTTPVEFLPAAERSSAAGQWKVSFYLPAVWERENLPAAIDPDVSIGEVPAETVAVHRFPGNFRNADRRQLEDRLRGWIREQDWEIAGPTRFAAYDPPWTLPFLRRNEVQIPVNISLTAGE